MTNTKLVQTLKTETNSLKLQFIDFTKEYATNEYNRLASMTFDEVRERWGFFDVKWNRYTESKESFRIWNKIVKMEYGGIENYVTNEVKNAEEHYEISIHKLALRIEKKGLNINALKCTTSHVGRNIETTLTDGITKVRAFTIIAEGAIQKPHYSYLVK